MSRRRSARAEIGGISLDRKTGLRRHLSGIQRGRGQIASGFDVICRHLAFSDGSALVCYKPVD
jgi:hypothetical protein